MRAYVRSAPGFWIGLAGVTAAGPGVRGSECDGTPQCWSSARRHSLLGSPWLTVRGETTYVCRRGKCAFLCSGRRSGAAHLPLGEGAVRPTNRSLHEYVRTPALWSARASFDRGGTRPAAHGSVSSALVDSDSAGLAGVTAAGPRWSLIVTGRTLTGTGTYVCAVTRGCRGGKRNGTGTGTYVVRVVVYST